jgi:hypothetical protein
MLETIPENMRLYREEEVYELVAERDPVYDEMEVASSARYYGVSTDEYRRRNQEAVSECDLNDFVDSRADSAPAVLWQNCKRAALWGLSQSVYLRRNDSVAEICRAYWASLSGEGVNQQEAVRECRIAVMRGVLNEEAR